ncbi:hypothetical protein A4G18_06365 [Pasteurellaceae bacterium Pebbles2]|nr:hypothetical protein [Pasteurellaceae bacterium Pebbles2]
MNNPDNYWGKWLKLSALKQSLVLIFFGLIWLYLPLSASLNHYFLLHNEQQISQQTQQQFEHQQRLWQSLKQQLDQQLLTPALASQLPPINQSVQALSIHLSLELSQWDFYQKPQLTLHCKGHFMDLMTFLTALLNQQSRLNLLSLHIQRSEDPDFSIESHIVLQLQPVQEVK